MAFEIDRAKTGEAAFGILSRRTRRLVETYIASLPFELHDDAPMFRTRGFTPNRQRRPTSPTYALHEGLARR